MSTWVIIMATGDSPRLREFEVEVTAETLEEAILIASGQYPHARPHLAILQEEMELPKPKGRT